MSFPLVDPIRRIITSSMRMNYHEQDKRKTAHEAWTTKLQLLIKENVMNPELSVSWLASRLFLSERQFSRKTRQITGLNPNLIIRETKLLAAHQLLSNKEVTSVKATAQALNFSDVKYFSRLFHQRFGIYPSGVVPCLKDQYER